MKTKLRFYTLLGTPICCLLSFSGVLMTKTNHRVMTCTRYLMKTVKQQHTCHKCVSPPVKITKTGWLKVLLIVFKTANPDCVTQTYFRAQQLNIHHSYATNVLCFDSGLWRAKSINIAARKLWSQWFTKTACILCSWTKLHVPWVMGSSILLAIQLSFNLNLIRFLSETLLM